MSVCPFNKRRAMIRMTMMIVLLGSFYVSSPAEKESDYRLNARGTQQRRMPDLTIPSVVFQKVESRKDAAGNAYWIFNVIITVKNQGQAAAGPFKVLLERNVGSGGAYTSACPTCLLDVAGLAAGQSITLPPRQFNNANKMNSLFRATADSTKVITESNENNNMNAENFQ